MPVGKKIWSAGGRTCSDEAVQPAAAARPNPSPKRTRAVSERGPRGPSAETMAIILDLEGASAVARVPGITLRRDLGAVPTRGVERDRAVRGGSGRTPEAQRGAWVDCRSGHVT